MSERDRHEQQIAELRDFGRRAVEQLGVAQRLAEQAVQQAELMERQTQGLACALRKCLDVLPGLEVHCWPPGHRMKREAIEAARAALAAADE